MNQRRRLTTEEREEARAAAHNGNPAKRVFVQEWTNADGIPVIVGIQDQ